MTRAVELVHKRPEKVLRVGVLVSGSGTNLQAILDACSRDEIPGQVVVVVSSSPKAYALRRAQAAGVPAVVLAPQDFGDRESYDARLVELLEASQVELVCLAGFLRILTPAFVRQFAGRIMNVHPALLPAFGGPGLYGVHVHRAVLASGAKVSGCTVHFADETPDGGPIILQAAVLVHDDDTAETLAARIAEEEHRLYPEAIRLFAHGRLQISGRRVQILHDTPTLVPS
jgi:phosphoribosylglycinamide formyltransferase-1